MPIRIFEATLRQPTLKLKDAMVIDLHGEVNGTVKTILNTAYEQAEAANPATIILNYREAEPQTKAFDHLETEMENVRSAWSHALDMKDFEAIQRAVVGQIPSPATKGVQL